MVSCQSDVCLFLAIGAVNHHGVSTPISRLILRSTEVVPDESVDLGGLDIVELLDGILDLTLVGLDVNNISYTVVEEESRQLHGTMFWIVKS